MLSYDLLGTYCKCTVHCTLLSCNGATLMMAALLVLLL